MEQLSVGLVPRCEVLLHSLVTPAALSATSHGCNVSWVGVGIRVCCLRLQHPFHSARPWSSHVCVGWGQEGHRGYKAEAASGTAKRGVSHRSSSPVHVSPLATWKSDNPQEPYQSPQQQLSPMRLSPLLLWTNDSPNDNPMEPDQTPWQQLSPMQLSPLNPKLYSAISTRCMKSSAPMAVSK